MRNACEQCGVDLPPDDARARICSWECTFCTLCAGEQGKFWEYQDAIFATQPDWSASRDAGKIFRQQVEKERSAGKRIVRKVVNISSTSGVNGNAGQSNYSAGKAGIVGLTKTLAKEFGRYDVTVKAVAFGYIQTRLTKPLL